MRFILFLFKKIGNISEVCKQMKTNLNNQIGQKAEDTISTC